MNIIQALLDTNNYWGKLINFDYIVLHHTGTMSSASQNRKYMSNPDTYVSAHYIVDQNWQVTQLVPIDYQARHCGKSKWWDKTNLNKYSVGIEIVSDGIQFTFEQFVAVTELILTIQEKDTEIVTHKQIAPDRKIDVWDNFFKMWGCNNIDEYKEKVQRLISIPLYSARMAFYVGIWDWLKPNSAPPKYEIASMIYRATRINK